MNWKLMIEFIESGIVIYFVLLCDKKKEKFFMELTEAIKKRNTLNYLNSEEIEVSDDRVVEFNKNFWNPLDELEINY